MSKTVELAHPVTINGAELKSVTMRRPTGLDYLAAQKKETMYEENVTMCAGLCGMTFEEFLMLDLADINKVVEGYKSFLSSPSAKKPKT